MPYYKKHKKKRAKQLNMSCLSIMVETMQFFRLAYARLGMELR